MWLRSLALLACAISGCGRIGFDATSAPSGSASLIQSATSSNNNHLGVSVAIAIEAGQLIVVGAVECCGSSQQQMITTLTDDGNNTYVSTGAAGSSTASTTEIWFASASEPATTVTVAFGNSGTYAVVWVAELSGVDKLDHAVMLTGNGAASAAGASIAASRAGEVIVSVLELDDDKLAGPPSDPFASLGAGLTQDCAYAIAGDAGLYAAVWPINTAASPTNTYAASTATFE